MDCNMDSSESDEDAPAAFMFFLYLLQRRIDPGTVIVAVVVKLTVPDR